MQLKQGTEKENPFLYMISCKGEMFGTLFRWGMLPIGFGARHFPPS